MQQQIVYTRWLAIDGNHGIDYVPFDLVFNSNNRTMQPTASDVEDYTDNTRIDDISIVDGYGVRLTMPGYLDCTHWSVFKTQEEAQSFLDEHYSDMIDA